MVTGNSHIVTINPKFSLGLIVTITHTGCKPVQITEPLELPCLSRSPICLCATIVVQLCYCV